MAFDYVKAAEEASRLAASERAATALDSSAEWAVRFFAVRALRKYRNKEAVDALVLLLADDDESIRAQAAGSLREIGTGAAGAVEALTRTLFDGDGTVRIASARALGAIGDQSAIPALVRAAETTAWDNLHSWVTSSLVQLGATEATGHLVRCLDDESWWTRRWAAKKLIEIGASDAAALEPLRRALARDRLHWWTYSRAIRAIRSRAAADADEPSRT